MTFLVAMPFVNLPMCFKITRNDDINKSDVITIISLIYIDYLQAHICGHYAWMT